MSLALTIRENQIIIIGETKLAIRSFKGKQFRILIDAPKKIPISRTEVYIFPEKKNDK